MKTGQLRQTEAPGRVEVCIDNREEYEVILHEQQLMYFKKNGVQ
jgi:hypothetical protein